MTNFLNSLATRFIADEEGVALTEYLVLLGLLVGGVIAAVVLFGVNLANVWRDWAAWFAGGTLTSGI